MKLCVVCLFVLGAIAISNADVSPEVKAKMLELIMRCKEQEGASVDDLKQLHTADSPPTPAKCVTACFQETNGLLKDGIFDSEIAFQHYKTAFNLADDKAEKMKQVYTECDGVGSGADRCEGAFQRVRCFRNAAQRLGLPVFNFNE